nr:hypothetical protein [Mycoplasmopsis bovis]
MNDSEKTKSQFIVNTTISEVCSPIIIFEFVIANSFLMLNN